MAHVSTDHGAGNQLAHPSDAVLRASTPDVISQADMDVEMDEDSPHAPLSTGVADTHTTRSAPAAEPTKKRPRLDLGALGGPGRGERKKKSIFGMVVGTLNRAKIEDKERMASEAAKKRHAIDARLQAKLSKEQTIVRAQDESKKDRQAASRKEDDLSVKDGILKHRYTVLPHLSNFLLTSDIIPPTDDDRSSSPQPPPVTLPHPPPTSNPPTLYYLPKILTPSQASFIARRKQQAEQRVAEEKEQWETEKRKGVEEVRTLKARSEAARKAFLDAQKAKGEMEPSAVTEEDGGVAPAVAATPAAETTEPADEDMAPASLPPAGAVAVAEEPIVEDDKMEQDGDDDAVEY